MKTGNVYDKEDGLYEKREEYQPLPMDLFSKTRKYQVESIVFKSIKG